MKHPEGGPKILRHKGGEQTGLLHRIKNSTPLRTQFSIQIDHSKATAPTLAQPACVADSEIEHTQRRTIATLTNESCRWPVGDPSTPSFFFCGHPSANIAERQPYCHAHAQRAFAGQGGRL